MRLYPYKFSKCAVNTKPVTDVTELLEKTMQGGRLSREEKNRIAEICYGVCSQYSQCYKLHGWCWDLTSCLPAFLVEYETGDIQKYYAVDKTALRKALHHKIRKIWG